MTYRCDWKRCPQVGKGHKCIPHTERTSLQDVASLLLTALCSVCMNNTIACHSLCGDCMALNIRNFLIDSVYRQVQPWSVILSHCYNVVENQAIRRVCVSEHLAFGRRYRCDISLFVLDGLFVERVSLGRQQAKRLRILYSLF